MSSSRAATAQAKVASGEPMSKRAMKRLAAFRKKEELRKLPKSERGGKGTVRTDRRAPSSASSVATALQALYDTTPSLDSAVGAAPRCKQRCREWWEAIGSPRFVCAPMVNQSELAFRMHARRHGTHSPACSPARAAVPSAAVTCQPRCEIRAACPVRLASVARGETSESLPCSRRHHPVLHAHVRCIRVRDGP